MVGFDKVDRAASVKFVPARFLRAKAEKVGVDPALANSEEHLRRLIREAEDAKKPVDNAKQKAGDTQGGGQTTAVPTVTPAVTINVPIPQVNVSANSAPQWFDVAAGVRDAVLYMIAGGAGFALILKLMGVL